MQPALRRLEDRLGQDQAVGRDHRQIGVERAEPRLLLLVAQRSRRPHLDAQLLGALVHRGLALGLAAARRPRRLAIDRDDLMPRLDQRVEARHRELRRSHEDDPHRAAPMAKLQRGKLRYLTARGQSGNRSLSQALARLPGPRAALGAARGAAPDEEARDRARSRLLAALTQVADKLSTCSTCGNVDTSDPCSICTRPAPRRQDAVRGRGGRRPVGARPLAAVPRPLPRARRPAVGARRRAARGSHASTSWSAASRRAASTRSCWR